MKGLFMDAVDDLAAVFKRVVQASDPAVTVKNAARSSRRSCPS